MNGECTPMVQNDPKTTGAKQTLALRNDNSMFQVAMELAPASREMPCG
jgi:hypothetical protein